MHKNTTKGKGAAQNASFDLVYGASNDISCNTLLFILYIVRLTF